MLSAVAKQDKDGGGRHECVRYGGRLRPCSSSDPHVNKGCRQSSIISRCLCLSWPCRPMSDSHAVWPTPLVDFKMAVSEYSTVMPMA
jgi:hypothetical protein